MAFSGGVHVGGLGIVVKLHAGNFAGEFQAMLDAAKSFHAAGDGCGRRARKIRSRACRQNVFDVVFAAQRNLVAAREHGFRAFVAKNDFVVAQEMRRRRRVSGG